jgi:hypothetical protein
VFRKNFINIDCFTSSQMVEQASPIQKASSYIPDWWKNLNSSVVMNHPTTNRPYSFPTMKTCYGFVELYRHGLVMPLWTDLELFIEPENYAYHAADFTSSIERHGEHNWGHSYTNYYHMKLISPWMIREKSGVKFMFAPCVWSHLDQLSDIRVLPGIVNYKYQHFTNINWFVPKVNKRITLPLGTPMIHMLPLTDKKLNIKTHVVDEKEILNMKKFRNNRFVGSFIRFMRTAEKCPMGDHK